MHLGQPASDPIVLQDQLHRTMMERGSNRLASAISIYRQGWVPKASNDDVMWLRDIPVGSRVREAANDIITEPSNRDPCAGCGVRADRHAESGCASYKRGRAA